MSGKQRGKASPKTSKASKTSPKRGGQNRPRRARVARGSGSRNSVALAPYASNPMRMPRVSTRSRQDGSCCRIKGTDFLTSVNISGTAAAAGDVLVSQVVNPKMLGVARLATMSQLYERYKFRSLKFRYSPVANATVSGQIIGYVDYDTYDDPTGLAGVQNLQRAAAHYGEKPVQVWQGSEKPVFWEIKDVDPLTDLYIDSDGTDPRWTNQGRFVLLAASTIAANTPCGNIYLDYDIEFYIPQLELTPTSGYGLRLSGSTSCSSTAFLGSTASAATWSNLPYSWSGNSITLQPGAYLAAAWFAGGTVTGLTITSTGTLSLGGSGIDGGATSATAWNHVYSASVFTITFTAAAASYTTGVVEISLLPRDALTLSARTKNRIENLVRRLGDIDDLRKTLTSDASRLESLRLESLQKSTGQDSKESKSSADLARDAEIAALERALVRTPVTRTLTVQSASAASSSSSSSTSSGSFRGLDEDYVRVRRS